MNLTRVLIGLVGVLHGLYFFKVGYVESRSGEEHVLPLFAWIPTEQWIMALALIVIVVGSALVTFNVKIQWTAGMVAAGFAYVLFSDWWIFHHSTFLAGNLFALLAWSGSRKEEHKRAATRAIMILFFAVYIFAGLHKVLGPEFRSGFIVQEVNTAVSRMLIDTIPGFVLVSVWGTIVVELLLPFALLHRKTRLWAAVLGIGFHIMVLLCTGRGPLFNLYLPACYPLFLVAELSRAYAWLAPRVPGPAQRVLSHLAARETAAARTTSPVPL